MHGAHTYGGQRQRCKHRGGVAQDLRVKGHRAGCAGRLALLRGVRLGGYSRAPQQARRCMHVIYSAAQHRHRLSHLRRRVCEPPQELGMHSGHQARLGCDDAWERPLRGILVRQVRIDQLQRGCTASSAGCCVRAPCLAQLKHRAADGPLSCSAVLPRKHEARGCVYARV